MNNLDYLQAIDEANAGISALGDRVFDTCWTGSSRFLHYQAANDYDVFVFVRNSLDAIDLLESLDWEYQSPGEGSDATDAADADPWGSVRKGNANLILIQNAHQYLVNVAATLMAEKYGDRMRDKANRKELFRIVRGDGTGTLNFVRFLTGDE